MSDATTCPATLDGNACTEPRGHAGFHRCPGHAWDDFVRPTDADVEHLRRAMVEAHQTAIVLDQRRFGSHDSGNAIADLDKAIDAYLAAKRARGGA